MREGGREGGRGRENLDFELEVVRLLVEREDELLDPLQKRMSEKDAGEGAHVDHARGMVQGPTLGMHLAHPGAITRLHHHVDVV